MWRRANFHNALDSDSNMRVSVDAEDVRDVRARAHILTGIAHQQHLEGYLFRELEMAANALKEYREAVRLRPDLPIAHYYLGVGLRGAKRDQEAQAEFARAEQMGDAAFRAALHKKENDEKQRRADYERRFGK